MIPEPKGPGMAHMRVEFFMMGNKTMIRKIMAGALGSIIENKATAKEIEEHPKEWAAFQNNQALPDPEGISLLELPGFTEQLKAAYKFQGIHTCEQLAEASDAICQHLGMGALNFRKAAGQVIRLKQLEAEKILRDEAMKVVEERKAKSKSAA